MVISIVLVGSLQSPNYCKVTRILLNGRMSEENQNCCIRKIVLLVSYLELYLKWSREGFKNMNQKTREQMTMHMALSTRY